MSWFSSLFSSATGSLVSSIGDLADRFIQTPEEKAQFTLQIERLLQERDGQIEHTIRTELQAKERILVAELSQSDVFTKRARPTVVYAGLAFIGINYVAFPLIARTAQALGFEVNAQPLEDLPTEFWVAWGGICSSWVIGRSVEKRGMRPPFVSSDASYDAKADLKESKLMNRLLG